MTFVNRRNVERLIIVLLSLAAVSPFVGEPLRVEYALMGFRFAVVRSPGDLSPIVVVLADTDSESRLGRPYDSSWREYYPTLIDVVEQAGARAIVWDAAFSATQPDLDPALAERLNRGIPVIAGEDRASRTVPVLREAFAEIGWLPFVGTDAMPRRIPVVSDPAPLAWHAAGYLRAERPELSDREIWIDYTVDPVVVSFSMADVLLADEERMANELRTPLSVFRDKVVFIGLSLPATDRYPLPGTGGTRVPGVYAQVAASMTLARDRRIHRVGTGLNLLFAGLIASALTVAWTLTRRRPRQISTVLIVLAGLVLPLLFFAAWRIWISYSACLIALIVPLVAVGIRRRAWLTKSYRTSLGFDPELIERHRGLIESYSTGIEREAVVLCSDVRNYTQFVTDHPPDQVQRVMSEYMEAMETIVDSHGGYVNKYVGDEIVAVFGFPRSERDVVNQAVRAALAMLRRLAELRDQWAAAGFPQLEAVGIGLDTGPLRFTHIGGRNRVQFDIIGNPINGASRLQVLTKVHRRPLILPAEMVEIQNELEVAMYGDSPQDQENPSVTFIGEVMIRGQGRRRVYGLVTGDAE